MEAIMAYHIYHSEAIVLQTKSVGDANVVLFLYTKDMGLVVARATSLRLHRSRLRFSLQRFSRAHVDLVRGRHGWLLTSARTINTNSQIFRHEYRKTSYAVLTGILLRLIQGEESNKALYDDVCSMLNSLSMLDTREECFCFELLASVRILNELGYWSTEDSDLFMLEDLDDLKNILRKIFLNRKLLVPRINNAYNSTSL
jgi:DNA repair protein RecO